MILYLHHCINNAKTDEQSFFRSAYIWRFGKDADVSNDVCQYKLHGIVPRFVEEYVANIQQKGGDQSSNPQNRDIAR